MIGLFDTKKFDRFVTDWSVANKNFYYNKIRRQNGYFAENLLTRETTR